MQLTYHKSQKSFSWTIHTPMHPLNLQKRKTPFHLLSVQPQLQY